MFSPTGAAMRESRKPQLQLQPEEDLDPAMATKDVDVDRVVSIHMRQTSMHSSDSDVDAEARCIDAASTDIVDVAAKALDQRQPSGASASASADGNGSVNSSASSSSGSGSGEPIMPLAHTHSGDNNDRGHARRTINLPHLDKSPGRDSPVNVASNATRSLSSSFAGGSYSFEEIMSPRAQNGGKRFLNGYMQHRVAMAGGFLKSWKRKYFRLRDHALLCYKGQDDSTPLFEVVFTVHTHLQLDSDRQNGKVSATSMVIVLQSVDVVGHTTPTKSVETPIYLKAENADDFARWVGGLRNKIEARKRAMTSATVHTVVTTDEFDMLSPPHNASAEDWNNINARRSLEERQNSNRSDSNQRDAQLTRQASGSPSTSRGSVQPVMDPATMSLVFSSTPDLPEFQTFKSKFLLLKEIGEGAFSIVHKGVSRLTGQLHAIKCSKASAALEEEVGILRKLSHPNVVSLEGVYKEDEMYYVVMDFLGDGDLCDLLIRRQRLNEHDAKVIVYQVIMAIDYLHRRNILHRDIKPENILTHGNIVKLADFGLAKQLPNASSMLKRSCGTLEYAAPEILCGRAYGLKSDIFSLGVVLYVLLYGAFPFSVESAAALQRMERFPDGVDVRDMSCLSRQNEQWKLVSPEAQDILLKMLTANEKERPSAKDLLQHPWLEAVSESMTVASVGTPHASRETNVEEEEVSRIADCRQKGFVELLSRGLEMIKYGNKGTTSPHSTILTINIVDRSLSWTAKPNPIASALGTNGSSRKLDIGASKPQSSRTIRFENIKEVRLGHGTDAFLHGRPRPIPEVARCLSIISTSRSLDLELRVASQRDFLAAGLAHLLKDVRVTPPLGNS
ncbi:TPA: hypothetical protein N0F65_007542 [Lagenidium giganteum]|uniref:CAMK/CAMK2 protein kinase n=1 Tax=Lagenidium giganteum TaxID=4803 RepID=A0AAV2ZIR3_9STRA|nr:TPA: hypothetical protein N0F65_007542 [Lagenidium giganteum]